MADIGKILDALYSLRTELGADIERFINIDGFAHSREFVERYSAAEGAYIAAQYLPGFQFQNLGHAAWHFKHRDFAAYWIYNARIPPELFHERWVRAILVPSRTQYLAEVAHALQAYDHHVAKWIGDLHRLAAAGDERELGRAVQLAKLLRALRGLPPGRVRGVRDLMGMPSWPNRIRQLFPEAVIPTTERSLIRWPTRVAADRRARRAMRPPSGWYIKSINYLGAPLGNVEAASRTMAPADTGYLESWEWAPMGKRRSPKVTSLSFRLPADPTLWDKPWQHRRIKLL